MRDSDPIWLRLCVCVCAQTKMNARTIFFIEIQHKAFLI